MEGQLESACQHWGHRLAAARGTQPCLCIFGRTYAFVRREEEGEREFPHPTWRVGELRVHAAAAVKLSPLCLACTFDAVKQKLERTIVLSAEGLTTVQQLPKGEGEGGEVGDGRAKVQQPSERGGR